MSKTTTDHRSDGASELRSGALGVRAWKAGTGAHSQALAGQDIAGPPPPDPLHLAGPEGETLAARREVCAELVKGCEAALLAVRLRTGDAPSPRDVRIGLAAAALLEDILASWRDALSAFSDDGW